MSTFDAASFDAGSFDAAKVINAQKIQVKLATVLAKDAQKIYAAHIFLPRLGIPTSSIEVQQWLDKVSSLLQTIQSTTGTQLAINYNATYNQLCASCKQIVDDPNNSLQEPCLLDQDHIVTIRLYKFATEP